MLYTVYILILNIVPLYYYQDYSTSSITIGEYQSEISCTKAAADLIIDKELLKKITKKDVRVLSALCVPDRRKRGKNDTFEYRNSKSH